MKESKMEYNIGNIEKYNTKNPLKIFMLNKFLKKILCIVKEMDKSTPNTILDGGCGERVISNLLYDNFPKYKITAVDYFKEAIYNTEKNNQRPIVFDTGDITSLEYEDNSFDVVISTEVLEHIPLPVKGLRELYRVCKKYIILSVPSEPFFCLGNLASGKNIKRLGNPIDHINHWTYWGFKKFVINNLPKTIKVTQYNLFVWTIVVITKQKEEKC